MLNWRIHRVPMPATRIVCTENPISLPDMCKSYFLGCLVKKASMNDSSIK
jgi:hypothetical protein